MHTTPSSALAMLIVDFVGVVCGFRDLTYLSELQTHPNLHNPRLTRVKREVVPSEGLQIWVCLFLYGQSLRRHPHDWPYRNKHTQICTPRWERPPFDPTQTGAVQIRVGLEFVDYPSCFFKRSVSFSPSAKIVQKRSQKFMVMTFDAFENEICGGLLDGNIFPKKES